jgi:hypothetical protein
MTPANRPDRSRRFLASNQHLLRSVYLDPLG